MIFFFFSSRRRHTRWTGDWSSDVCSSDLPAGVRHSPRFSPDSFLLVLERKRRSDERDRFFWYCEKCHAELYEAVRHVADYREDPVSRVYEEFYSEESRRTCGKCGHVTPRPAG